MHSPKRACPSEGIAPLRQALLAILRGQHRVILCRYGAPFPSPVSGEQPTKQGISTVHGLVCLDIPPSAPSLSTFRRLGL